MPNINKGRLKLGEVIVRQAGNDWPTAQVTYTSDVLEVSSNLYFTNTRVLVGITTGTIQGNVTVSDTISANSLVIRGINVTNNVTANTVAAAAFSGNSLVVDIITANTWNGLYTANVIETAGNLYFTNARVVAALIPGTGIEIEANGRISANTASVASVVLSGITTDNVTEGTTNKYFTNTRVVAALSAGDNIVLEANGRISATTDSQAIVVNDSETITAIADTLTYAITRNITDPRSILVINEGLVQIPLVDYDTAGSAITFTSAPPASSLIEIRYFGIDSSASVSSTFLATVNTFTGNGANTIFELSTTPGGKAYTAVIIDGVSQQSSAYSLNGKNLIFSEAPASNAEIDVRIYAGLIGSSFNTRTFTGDGITNAYPVTTGFGSQNILVFENGIAQVADVDYTVDLNSIVTFATAPAANIVVQIRELGSGTANLVNQIAGRDIRTGNLVPLNNNSKTLGTANLRYNKLYLTDANSLIIGNTTIGVSGTSFTLTSAGVTTTISGGSGGNNSRTTGYSLVFGGF